MSNNKFNNRSVMLLLDMHAISTYTGYVVRNYTRTFSA